MGTFNEALFILDKSLANLEDKVGKLVNENHTLLINTENGKKKESEFKLYKEKTLKELYTLREVIKNEIQLDIKKNVPFTKKDYRPSILMSNE